MFEILMIIIGIFVIIEGTERMRNGLTKKINVYVLLVAMFLKTKINGYVLHIRYGNSFTSKENEGIRKMRCFQSQEFEII